MKFRGEPVQVGTYYFVDEFNEEFNRDIEPQDNPEYSDNFYYQLAAFMRRSASSRNCSFVSTSTPEITPALSRRTCR